MKIPKIPAALQSDVLDPPTWWVGGGGGGGKVAPAGGRGCVAREVWCLGLVQLVRVRFGAKRKFSCSASRAHSDEVGWKSCRLPGKVFVFICGFANTVAVNK